MLGASFDGGTRMSDERSGDGARIDAYIAGAAPFAVPILQRLRADVHQASEEVVEAIKWSMPAFTYRGKMVANLAAFKAHVAFGFWHGAMVTGDADTRRGAMGDLGRITHVDQLPDSAIIIAWVRRQCALIDEGVKPPHLAGRTKHPQVSIDALPDFAAKLAANPLAKGHFDSFPPSAQREYIDWIASAKRDATRAERITTAIDWLANGRRRNWKYAGC